MKLTASKIGHSIGLIALSICSNTYAAPTNTGGSGTGTGSGGGLTGTGAKLLAIACKLINYLYTALIILAVGMFMYAGWHFIWGAKEGKLSGQANKITLWTIVGLVIIMIAMGVPSIIASFLDVPGVPANPCNP